MSRYGEERAARAVKCTRAALAAIRAAADAWPYYDPVTGGLTLRLNKTADSLVRSVSMLEAELERRGRFRPPPRRDAG